MKWNGILLAVMLACGVIASGCGGSQESKAPPVPENPEEAASAIEKTFENSPPTVRRQATEATRALRERDFTQAAESLNQMQQQPDLTFDQRMKIRNSMIALQQELAEARESNDPEARKKAQEAIRRLRQQQQQQR